MSEQTEERVLIQGNHHSFHAQAATRIGIPLDACIPMNTHRELYETLYKERGGTAVVAVANSTIGRIKGSYEQLCIGRAMVTSRIDLPVAFNLYGVPGATIEDIRVIHTQSHAYSQCANTLKAWLPHARWQEEQDTAGSAIIVSALSKLGNRTHAAVCPQGAGEAAGLVCLREGIQDQATNVTTFYRLSGTGDADMPKDADVAVAILDTTPNGYTTAEQKVHSELNIKMRPLHVAERDAGRLIVELETADNHQKVIARAKHVLGNRAGLTYIGGYRRGADQPITT